MALSFLCLAFVRMLQLLQLLGRDNGELAVEVVMLRHEAAVLRRQVARPEHRPPDRALFAGRSRPLRQPVALATEEPFAAAIECFGIVKRVGQKMPRGARSPSRLMRARKFVSR